MKILEALKPTRWKLIVSAVITFLYILFMRSIYHVICDCYSINTGGLAPQGLGYSTWLLLPEAVCNCGYFPLKIVLFQYLNHLIIPFIVIYLGYSLVMLVKNRK